MPNYDQLISLRVAKSNLEIKGEKICALKEIKLKIYLRTTLENKY